MLTKKPPIRCPGCNRTPVEIQVGLFFESLAAVEIHNFAPTAILEGQGIVVALVDIEFTVKKTGKRVVETDEAHVWRFDDAGKVTRFRHCADTYQNAMAIKG